MVGMCSWPVPPILRDLSRRSSEVEANNAAGATLLEIERLSGDSAFVLSECRWSRAYGPSCIISGWHFINMQARPKVIESILQTQR